MGSIRLTSVTDAPKIGFTLENCVNTQKSKKVECAKKLKLTERLFQKRVWFLKYFTRKEDCISKNIASSRYEHGTVSCVDDKIEMQMRRM